MKAPSRIGSRLNRLRQQRKRREAAEVAMRAQKNKEAAEKERARRRQEPLAFWMKRELTNEKETTIDNWRMLVQMPPGVWQRTWDAFNQGTAHYNAELLDGAAHLSAALPHMRKLWWEIKITGWGLDLAFKIGQDYPEMMRQCLGEAIERVDGAHDHVVPEHRRAALVKTLREGEQLCQAWIARYAAKEAP